jgi:hypothetical protein
MAAQFVASRVVLSSTQLVIQNTMYNSFKLKDMKKNVDLHA